MTIKQFRKKADIAKKNGMVKLEDGDILYYFEKHGWSIHDKNDNTIDTADTLIKLEYLLK